MQKTRLGLIAIQCLILSAALELSAMHAPPGAGDSGIPDPVNAAGYSVDLDALPSPHPRPVAEAAAVESTAPLFVRVGIPRPLVEKSPGAFDWAVTDEIVEGHTRAGFAVILEPREGPSDRSAGAAGTGGAAGSAFDEGAWVGFLRALAGRYSSQVDHYLVGREWQGLDARPAAYRIKVSAVSIQSADPGARVALGPIDPGRPGAASWHEALYGEQIAAYVSAIALAGVSDAATLSAIRSQLLLNDPSSRVWVVDLRVGGGAPAGGALLRRYLEALGGEAALAIFDLDAGPDGMPELLGLLRRIRDLFLPGLSPLVESARGIQVATPMGDPVAVRTLRLFDPDTKRVLIAYDAGPDAVRGAQAVMAIDTLDFAEPVLRDVAAGEQAIVGGWQKDDAAGLIRVALPLADYPLLLEYRRFTSPLFGEEESLEVTGVRLPSVDEILARHQAFQAAQDALLVNLRAEARVDYHFKIGSGSTVDVTLLNNFYLDPNVGAEFEQKEFRVGGVKWRSDRIPEFPLPQPEKVMTLPLDIALDKRYGYRLAGEETIDGYACWVIEFDPVVPDASLYRGRVWIDRKTFAKVQIASVQTGLEPPILSNDETDSYRPIRGPDGIEYWVLSRIDGQQIFSTSGRNLILVREVAFTDHVINDAGFVELRRQAYASERSILRDTPSGQKYLERTPEGDRVVKEDVDRDNLFGLGGVYYNRSLDFPVPLAGINYFNRDLGGRGIQTNVFFAGVLLFANLSDPDLFGVGLEGSVDLSARGFSATDRPVRLGEERDEESIDRISQRLGLGLGIPFADYWKVKLTGGLEFDGFSRDEETDPRAIDPAFVAVIPQDTWILTYGMEGEFNRDAWSVAASVEVSDRRDWDCWGFFDPSLASCSAEFRPESQDYMRYQGTVARDFFLPFHQKIHASVTGYGGGDLDRFSKYQFDFFSNRLRGLSGAGLRFTNGARAQIQYAFNLGEIIRFEATVDHARVRDRSPADPGEDDFRGFTGFGISGQTIVGPDLIVSLDYGIAVSSDIEDFRGDQEILLSILRIFR